MQWYYIVFFAALIGFPICLIDDAGLRQHIQKYYFIALSIFLILFAGLRSPYVDRDYINYLEWFNGIAAGSLSFQDWLKDPAFVIISYILATLGFGYVGVALTYATVSINAKLYFSGIVSGGRWLTLFFYLVVCRSFIRHEMTQTRAGVAIALMSISIYLASRGSKRKSILFYLLALIFHISTLLGLPVWLLTLRGIKVRSRLWLALLIPLAVILKFALQNVLQMLADFSRVSPYINGEYGTAQVKIFSAYFVIRVSVLLLVVIVYWGRLSAEQRLATLCSSIGIFLLVALSANNALALRSADIFGLFELVVFMIPMQFIKGHLRLIYAVLLICLGVGFFIDSLELIGPYQWIFS